MNIVRCDICDKEMRFKPFECDSETQYYTLINKYGGRDIETDICNECMHKLIDFVNTPSVVPTTEQSSMVGEWVESEIPNELYVCSECGGACWSYDWDRTIVKSFYCPNCGAKMKG